MRELKWRQIGRAVFATEAMGCAGRKASEGILNDLAAFFVGMMTRRPEKITCG